MSRRQEPQKPRPAPPTRKAAPEAIAKAAVARRLETSGHPGHVRLTVMLPAALAEQLAARAIREEKNLEQLLVEFIERAAR